MLRRASLALLLMSPGFAQQLRGMITFAYDVRDFQISGEPGWVGTERFDVMARPERASADDLEDLAKRVPYKT